MNQLFGQPSDPFRSDDGGLGASSVAARPVPVIGAEQAFFHLDFRRSLQLHWRLALNVAIAGVVLAVSYFLGQAFVFKSWPAYEAESLVYVQPTPPKVLEPSQGGAPRWPYDTNTYESYIQQQMMNVTRDDVLASAIKKLDFRKSSRESEQASAQRLAQSLTVTREGSAYQFSIAARAGSAQRAADVANAVTAAYMESATRDQRTGDAQRLSMLREERDRILHALAADHTEQEALNRQLGVASVGAAVPDHYDEDITETRTELIKARSEHDAAEAKFASLDAGRGPSSAAIDAEADEMIANDAGLVSMKTALNTRRATLISQMANLTPSHPQYKQDEAELVKINSTLDGMMKDLRDRAAARIQLQLRADLQRTAGVESQVNGQLRQLVGAAGGATPKLQRSSDLAADITRLQARFASVDEQLHNLMLEDNAPAAAYQVTPAAAPLSRTKTGVMRNAAVIAFGGLLLGILSAAAAHRLDSRVYIAKDVELILGFAPMAQLPDFSEVSDGVAQEYLLRLASSIEHARTQNNLRSCIFTGTGSGAGVSMLVNRVGEMLGAMGRPTVVVDATGANSPGPRTAPDGPGDTQGLVPVDRVSRPAALLQQMAEEAETQMGNLVLTDTSPLAVCAETEYLARFVDCAIVVIESGKTRRRELREAAATLQRLDVAAVGFVLNRVGLAKADPAFRLSVQAIETHLETQATSSARRTETIRSFVPENSSIPQMPAIREALPKEAVARVLLEQKLVATAAEVAVVSHPAVSGPAACMPSPMVSAPFAEAAQRLSGPLTAPPLAPVSTLKSSAQIAAAAEQSSSPLTAEPAVTLQAATGSVQFPESAKPFSLAAVAEPVPPLDVAPFAAVAKHFASPEEAVRGDSHWVPAVPVGQCAPDFAAPAAQCEPGSKQEPQPMHTAANTTSDVPWWLGEANQHLEPSRPPVLWQPAKLWVFQEPATLPESLAAGEAANLEPQKLREDLMQPREWVPGLRDTPAAGGTTRISQKLQVPQGPASLSSRLSGLRNLLFVMGVKDSHETQAPPERKAVPGPNFDSRIGRQALDRGTREERNLAEASIGGDSARLVTAPPEFLSPKPTVIHSAKEDTPAGESSTGQERRASCDRIDILPSRRGQYKET